MGLFSVQTITALTELVTGGSGTSHITRKGIYRSGPELEMFMGGCGFALRIGNTSRVPAVRNLLMSANNSQDALYKLVPVIEAAIDPKYYIHREKLLEEEVNTLNRCLDFDGYKLQLQEKQYRLISIGTMPVTSAIKETATALNIDSVQRDVERMLAEAESDPEDAITSSCSMIESVCRYILGELNVPLPNKKDISSLVTETQKQLNLSPERQDISPDIKRILGGLLNVSAGIGSLRTKAGDAHGRNKGTPRLSSRIARLSIHSASTVAIFFLETWQRQKAFKEES
ncbi:MAG TPA: abortive infection family protein [bacterium]|nr:abortive infection family protein [bacterium]